MLGRVNESDQVVRYMGSSESAIDAAAPYDRMVFRGGPVISAPELVSFYWGAFTQSEISGTQQWLRGFADYLSGAGWPRGQESVVRQYGIYGATIGAVYQETSAPTSANDGVLRSKLATLQQMGTLPQFSPERLFLFIT